MARESNFWAWIRGKLKGIPDLDVHRVENSVGSGMPDVEGCYRGGQFWLELKATTRPVRPTTPIRVKFQPLQVHWLEKRWRCGGSCWVYLKVEDARYLVPGNKAHIVEAGVPEAELAALAVLPPNHTVPEMLAVVSSPLR